MESANNSRLVEHVDSMALQTMEAVPEIRKWKKKNIKA
jgi:hypothetical protein